MLKFKSFIFEVYKCSIFDKKINDMTPKEKALELLWKYLPITKGWEKKDSDVAIKCALIAVDEILNNYYKNHFSTGKKIDYWLDVKKEIEKL